jgi:hypothetical protein
LRIFPPKIVLLIVGGIEIDGAVGNIERLEQLANQVTADADQPTKSSRLKIVPAAHFNTVGRALRAFRIAFAEALPFEIS